jgi:D-glycero-D-manno-heptose 1,7-bisphosphate phosphatase
MQNLTANMLRSKAIFLDRDGTINEDTGYLNDFRDFKMLSGVELALKRFQDLGFQLFVVSNQSGVARGYFTLEQVMQLNLRIRDFFREKGIGFTDMAICPHHPEGSIPEYTRNCLCRKPLPGMIVDLIKRYHIDPMASYMVGDRDIDVQAGLAAGVKGILIGKKPDYSFLDTKTQSTHTHSTEFASLLDFAQSLGRVAGDQAIPNAH